MKGGKQIIVDFLEGIRRDSIEDLHDKNISQGDLGMKTRADDDGGDLSGLHYWYFLVNGRRPGKRPPIDSILGWLEKKGITADIPLRSLAFLIARKIGRLGTDIFLGKRPGLALPQIIELRTKDFRKDMREHFREEIKKEIGGQLRQIFAA
jgi:hypothetical protein